MKHIQVLSLIFLLTLFSMPASAEKPDAAKATGAAILVCPGGGFMTRATDFEGVLRFLFLASLFSFFSFKTSFTITSCISFNVSATISKTPFASFSSSACFFNNRDCSSFWAFSSSSLR